MKHTDDVMSDFLILAMLDDLWEVDGERAIGEFQIRAFIRAANSPSPLKRWASLGGRE